MKKYSGLIIIAVVIILLIGVIFIFSDNEEKYLKEISISDVMKKQKNNDNFMLFIKQDNCEHCKAFTPKFLSVLRNKNLKAYVLNISNLSDDDKDIYDDNFDVDGTPTVLFFDEGNESIVRIEGEQSKEKIISKLEAAGFIK